MTSYSKGGKTFVLMAHAELNYTYAGIIAHQYMELSADMRRSHFASSHSCEGGRTALHDKHTVTRVF